VSHKSGGLNQLRLQPELATR